MKDAAILVFARQPRPGRVKTRLAAGVGPQEACRIYAGLLEHTLDAVRQVDCARRLALPPGDHVEAPGFERAIQRGADLGERMDDAFRRGFDAGFSRLVLVGSDLPGLTPGLLERALSALLEQDTVFGPAADGGYWLVGQRTEARDLFHGIPWSTQKVWPLTRARLAERGWTHATLPVLEDVDDLDSWTRHAG